VVRYIAEAREKGIQAVGQSGSQSLVSIHSFSNSFTEVLEERNQRRMITGEAT